MNQKPYQPKYKIRIVTAASLFDGHDAAINIMRRIIQSTGCEVIHLGHDRSVEEVVNCAIQEDANAIAMTSYQGGHNEYLKYMFDLLKKKNSSHIKIFAGGGGTILPEEIKDLHKYGITKIYHPDDGRKMGLQGMINDLVKKSDFPLGDKIAGCIKDLNLDNNISRLISAAENYPKIVKKDLTIIKKLSKSSKTPVLGITGTGGAGKSSLVDELLRRFLNDFKEKKIGVICVDPSKRKSGGALLGDRIRMNSSNNPRIYMRSLATRQANLALSAHVNDAISILKAANFDLIINEGTSLKMLANTYIMVKNGIVKFNGSKEKPVNIKSINKDIKWNDSKNGYDFGAINWDEFWQVVGGNGPCNQERVEARRKAKENGSWVMEAAAAFANKRMKKTA